jgi:protease IV
MTNEVNEQTPEQEASELTPEHNAILLAVKTLVDPLMDQNKRDFNFRRYKFWLVGAFFVGILFMRVGAEQIEDFFNLDNEYVSLVKISGPIMPGSSSSAESIIPFMEKAFEDDKSKGVIIHINSPGGTPVASSAIRNRIVELREEYPDKKVIAVGSDYMTSGAYMVASGAETIYANESSLVGSIGVIVRAFGADKLAEKVGVERRVIYAGQNKSGMDTFLPLTTNIKDRLQSQLAVIHEQFINKIKSSRGDKLDTTRDDMFTGAYWTGEEARSMGLIDGLGHLSTISEKEFGTSEFKVLAAKKTLFEAFNPLSSVTSAIDAYVSLSSHNRPLLMIE